MGTQTQNQNRGQQQGGDKRDPTLPPGAPHDPRDNPERDEQNPGQRRTADQNPQRNPSGSGKRSSTDDADLDDDAIESEDQPGKSDTIDE